MKKRRKPVCISRAAPHNSASRFGDKSRRFIQRLLGTCGELNLKIYDRICRGGQGQRKNRVAGVSERREQSAALFRTVGMDGDDREAGEFYVDFTKVCFCI